MKKVKLNLDKKAIQDFFIYHVEKVLLAAVAVCFLVFAYRAVGREKFTGTPQELKTDSEKADQWVQATKPVPPDKVVNTNYLELVKKSNEPIDVTPYEQRHLWRPLEVPPPPKRGEPLLFPVKDLRGAAGCGAVKAMTPQGRGMGEAFGPGGGRMMPGESLRGERWVVLTGLVPVVEQYKAYYDAFKNVVGKKRLGRGGPGGMEMGAGSQGANVEVPVYWHYRVERAEITSPGQSVDDLQWERINVLKAKIEATRDWGSGRGVARRDPMAEGLVVSPIYITQALDFPLPPLVGQDSLGDDFAHPPEIPALQKLRRPMLGPDGRPLLGRDGRPIMGPAGPTAMGPDGQPVGAAAPGMEQPGVEQPGVEQPGVEQPGVEQPGVEQPGVGQPGVMPAGGEDMPPLPGAGRGGRVGMEAGVMGPGMMAPGVMGPGMMNPEMMNPEMMPGMPGVGPRGLRPGQRMAKPVPYHLFRFVDRTVEPGKRYRYRVRLVLLNPNYNQDPRTLERLELGKKQTIETDWSDPTSVIRVPRDDRMLVESVRPPIRPSAEPEAKVLLVKWIHDKGIQADKEMDRAGRGQVLNLLKCKWPEKEAKPRPKPKKKKRGPGVAPGMEDYEMLMEGPQPEAPRRGMTDMYGPPEEEPIDVDYLSESLILDMRGGGRIDLNGQGRPPSSKEPRLNAPGEILVLDPEGNLVVRSELDDAAEYQKIQERKKEPEEGRMGPGMYPGMEMMPGDEALLMESAQPGRGAAKKAKDRRKTGRRRPGTRERLMPGERPMKRR